MTLTHIMSNRGKMTDSEPCGLAKNQVLRCYMSYNRSQVNRETLAL